MPSSPPSLPTSPQPTVDLHALFEPYRRISPAYTPGERVRTALATVVLLPFRILFLLFGVIFIYLTAVIATIFLRDKSYFLLRPLPAWRKTLLSFLYPALRAILFLSFGVYSITSSARPFTPLSPADRKGNASSPGRAPGAYVIVANHLGYLDILVMLAKYRSSFVAKGSLEHAPIIGTVASALQCMFVRENQSLTSQLISRVESTYACHAKRATCTGCGSCLNKIVIFPEGTTTNGESMVAFRTGVFNAGVPVRPVCIRFPYRNFNLSWESIRFWEHLYRTMTQWRNCVDMIEMPPYIPSEDEKSDARLFSKNVQAQMARVLDQPVVLLNRKHKFLYHKWLTGKVADEGEVVAEARKLEEEDPLLQYLRLEGGTGVAGYDAV